MSIRAAVPDDADAMAAVWAAVAAEGEWIGTELPLRPDWADGFRAAFDGDVATWFTAVVDDEVVGGLFVQDARGVAHVGMALADGHRGRGLGRGLLDAAIAWARDRGCHKVSLEVWPHNTRARRLYERAGFLDEGVLRRHHRRRNGSLWDSIVMGLVLDEDRPGHP